MDNAFVLPADAAIPLLWKFLNRWPSAEQARKADKERIAKMLQPLGLHETRAATIIRFSGQYFLLFADFALISSYASGSNSYLFCFLLPVNQYSYIRANASEPACTFGMLETVRN